MTLNVGWHPGATAEFDADIDWYEEREVGLGDRLEVDVLAAVDAVVDEPGAWGAWRERVRW